MYEGLSSAFGPAAKHLFWIAIANLGEIIGLQRPTSCCNIHIVYFLQLYT